jgi:DNA-binding SARP family transcriptional activator
VDSRLFLFGLPRIEVDGVQINVERRKVFGLAAYLALNMQAHSREVLAALFWPELDQTRSLAALRRVLIDLRALMPSESLTITRQSIGLRLTDNLSIDVKVFESLIHASREQNVSESILSLIQAVNLYTGDFMNGFTLHASAEFDTWQMTEQESLRLKFAQALRQLVDLYSLQADYKQAITYAMRDLALDPLDEMRQRTLMHLYAQDGQISTALRQYQDCVRLLNSELGVEPMPETTTLNEQIRNKTIGAASGGVNITSVLPPLPILLIGRDKVRNELYQKLQREHPIIAIQGWPGVGKSTIAALLAHDPAIRVLYPDGTLWVSLGENPNLMAELSKWANALGIPMRGYLLDTEELSSKIAAALRDKKVLLIVDDVWQIAHANAFKVQGHHSAFVCTTRFNDIARELTPTPDHIYKLRVLEESAGLTLLKVLAPEVVARYPQHTVELVNDLEGLPLALQVAGCLLHTEFELGWSIIDLLNDLRNGEILMNADAPAGMIGLEQETRPTVAKLIQKSTDRLDETTRMRFAYLGLFAPKPATFDLGAMAAVWDVSDPRPIIRTLANRGLLEPLAIGRFQIHALLVIHARTIFALHKS